MNTRLMPVQPHPASVVKEREGEEGASVCPGASCQAVIAESSGRRVEDVSFRRADGPPSSAAASRAA